MLITLKNKIANLLQKMFNSDFESLRVNRYNKPRKLSLAVNEQTLHKETMQLAKLEYMTVAYTEYTPKEIVEFMQQRDELMRVMSNRVNYINKLKNELKPEVSKKR